jgi:hypothetical protein
MVPLIHAGWSFDDKPQITQIITDFSPPIASLSSNSAFRFSGRKLNPTVGQNLRKSE